MSRCRQLQKAAESAAGPSSEGAEECSPRRKPWVRCATQTR